MSNYTERMKALVMACHNNWGAHDTERMAGQLYKWSGLYGFEKVEKSVLNYIKSSDAGVFFPTESVIVKMIKNDGEVKNVVGPGEYCAKCQIIGCTRHRDRSRDNDWARNIGVVG